MYYAYACIVYIRVHSETVGNVNVFAFMNITPDVSESGYLQIYVVAPHNAVVQSHVRTENVQGGPKSMPVPN